VGIPESRTELVPEKEEEPEGLGPVVERWYLAGGRKVERAAAIASGVRKLLDDSSVQVRANESGTRRPGPRDVAVLCRTNEECLEVAEALHAIGISSVVERKGLLATPEAELLLAGLRLWIDGRDALAKAILLRLATYSGEEDVWLEAALRKPYAKGFAAADFLETIDLRRAAAPAAGLLQSLDGVTEAVGARDLAVSWGESEQRLANLDALRALAVSYLSESASRDAVGTIGGFLAWLETVEAAGQDARAEGGADAVFVGTFHGAKGLEWPITVLRDHEWEPPATALGIHVAEEYEGFDFDDPLAGRWIRFWPNPFYPTRKTFLQENLAGHPLTEALERRERREALRLIYVGWTRARDRLILASKSSRRLEKIFARVASDEGPLVLEPDDDEAVWAGRKVVLGRRELSAAPPQELENRGGEAYEVSGPIEHPPAFLSPSSLEAAGTAGEPEQIGERLALAGSPDMNTLGEVFHRFFAADRPELSDDERRSLALGLLERWCLEQSLEAGALLQAGGALRAWAERQWPGAAWRREWPLARRLENGTVLRGFADLVLELDEGFVLIDHKTFPGGREQAKERAAEYAGQLGAYVDAISAATGKDPIGSFIHLPVSGVVVEVRGPLDEPEGPTQPTQLSLFSTKARS
jgi:ATP-dependent exoDNAse (exonuclease V) beta subunit